MFKEIQRVAVLFTFFYSFIQAQDVTNVGGNIKVDDPFAKPDVDPFANLKPSATTSTTTIVPVKTSETKLLNTDSPKPVVKAGSVETSKVVSSSSDGKSISTSPISKTVGGSSDSLSSGTIDGNKQSGRSSTSETRTATLTKKDIETRASESVPGSSRGSGVGGRSGVVSSVTTENVATVGNAAGGVSGSKTRDSQKIVVTSDGEGIRRIKEINTDVSDTGVIGRASGRSEIDTRASNTGNQNKGTGSAGRSEASNVVRRTRIDTTNNLENVNNRREFSNEKNSRMLNMNIDTTRDNNNKQVGIGMMTSTEEPILYVRKLFRDQRICESCVGDGTDCYLEHPDDCRKYIRCSASSVGAGMEALEMDCAFGTFWSNEANTCDTASDVICEKDPCRDTRLKTYPSGINCRSYWRCVNGRSDSECCPHGEAYNDGMCLPSDSCKVDDGECPYKFRKLTSEQTLAEEENKIASAACHLEAIPGDITAYKMKDHWATMQCADGTRFDEQKCTCIAHVFNRVKCRPIADIDFKAIEATNKVRSYIDVNNVTIRHGYGLFNGRAYVAVPYFKNNQNIGTHFVIRMRFYHDGKQGYDSQVLASNCKTKTGRELSPSFAILLAKTKKEIIFFASTKQPDRRRYGATTSISLPYQPDKWTVVELRFLDELLFASVETLESDGTSQIVKDEKVLKGTLTTSVMPLMVGNCNMNDGFVGYVDMVKTYTCNPNQA